MTRREQKEARVALCKDVIAAWVEFEATGLHATAEAVDAWLLALAAGEMTKPSALVKLGGASPT